MLTDQMEWVQFEERELHSVVSMFCTSEVIIIKSLLEDLFPTIKQHLQKHNVRWMNLFTEQTLDVMLGSSTKVKDLCMHYFIQHVDILSECQISRLLSLLADYLPEQEAHLWLYEKWLFVVKLVG